MLVAMLPAVAGCASSDAPTPQEATAQATSAKAVQARENTSNEIGTTLTAIVDGSSLTNVATATRDVCWAGQTHGWYPHDDYRIQCSWQERRYLDGCGDILSALRRVDSAARGAGGTPDLTENISGVEYYFSHHGQDADGLTLPKPQLEYTLSDGTPIGARWREPDDSHQVELSERSVWPVVFAESHPVDPQALWSGPLKGCRHMITVSAGSVYYEVPWPA